MCDLLKNKKYRRIIIAVSVIFVIIGAFCFYFAATNDKYNKLLSVVGSLASILGIIIAIIQISHTKSIAKLTQESAERSEQMVKEGIEKVEKVFAMTDLMVIQHLPNEIQDAIQNRKWERAYEKMRNLKDCLVELQNNPRLAHYPAIKENLIPKTQALEVRIKAFSNGITNNTEPYAYNKASDLMEEIRTLLRTIGTTVKFDNIK